MKAFWRLFISNFKSYLRDRVFVFFTILFPILFMGLFGLLYGNESASRFNLGLVVEDTSPGSQMLVQALTSMETVFTISQGEREEELAALKAGKRRAVLVIPEGLSQSIAQGKPSELPAYYDASQATTSQMVLSILRQVVAEMNKGLTQRPDLLLIREVSIQAQRFRMIDYLVPGILCMAIMQLGIFATSGIVTNRQNLVLKRLAATPLSRPLLISAQTVQQVIICFFQAALLIVLGRWWFKVYMVGNWFVLIGLVILGGLVFISLGFVLASFARTDESYMAMAQMINFPMMFLSGIFFPIEVMPDFMRPVVKAFPLTYLGDALRQVMVGASALHSITTDVLVLVGWLAVCLAISFRFFRWE